MAQNCLGNVNREQEKKLQRNKHMYRHLYKYTHTHSLFQLFDFLMGKRFLISENYKSSPEFQCANDPGNLSGNPSVT